MTALSLIVGQLLLGWLLADLVGGFLHWLEDRVLPLDTPLLGRWIVAPNRLHHRDPLAFTAGSFLQRNGTTWAAATLVAVPLFALFGFSLVLATATIGGGVSSIVHYWAHRPGTAPAIVRVLQETGLFQSPKHHAGHHRPPSDRRYCVLTDWLNPALDALGFWPAIEQGLRRIGVPIDAGTMHPKAG